METFEGKRRVRSVKTRLGDKVRVTKDLLTRIPKRVVEIDAYPSSLKNGTVPVTEENVESTFKKFIKENKKVFAVEAEDLKLASAKKIKNRWYVKYDQYYKSIPRTKGETHG